MPTIDHNKAKWDGSYHWRKGGDHWSDPWGNAEMQWHASIWPRIHSFLPTKTILEIGPGFGRWTAFLKELCEELIVVDLSEKCIHACKERFTRDSHITYHVNDGRSLEMVPDDAIDFVFTYDSLVHTEHDVMEAYLRQLSRKLRRPGVGFIHHSNTGQYTTYFKWVRGISPLKLLFRILTLETKTHGRALTMSASEFRRLAQASGLRCIGQELINWRSRLLLDCHSIIAHPDSAWTADDRVYKNRDFMKEAGQIRRMASVYSRLGQSPDSPRPCNRFSHG